MRRLISDPGDSKPVQLKARLELERRGDPFLVLHDPSERQHLIVLEPLDERLWIGRNPACELALAWDDRVSRTHAELTRLGEGWAVADDGLSRNGTFVGGQRVVGRRRLHDGETIRVGRTTLSFRVPGGSGSHTGLDEDTVAAPDLTPMQRKVLAALCEPKLADRSAIPATNRAIADRLVLSLDAVKTHLRALFATFGVEGLPQNEKRARLAELAVRAGLAGPVRSEDQSR